MILKYIDVIEAADVAIGMKTLTKQRSQTLEELEKLFIIWINDKKLTDDNISESIICEKMG